jgi:hypothetical protein
VLLRWKKIIRIVIVWLLQVRLHALGAFKDLLFHPQLQKIFKTQLSSLTLNWLVDLAADRNSGTCLPVFA